MEPQEIGYADKGESGDAAVVVTRKDAKEDKYKPLTSFAESKLPSDVLQCCQNFKSPSPTQSRVLCSFSISVNFDFAARQMVMFRATWPPSVHQLAQEFMDPNPVKVVGSEDLAANHDVMQMVEVLDEYSCDGRLVALLEKCHKSKENRVLIFVLYKKEATCVEIMLQNGGWKVVSIHGDKAQSERTKALSLFKKGSCPLMVCPLGVCELLNLYKLFVGELVIATDVATRGLDIPDVEVVINYSFPLTTEDYESKLYGAHFKEIPADASKSQKITFNSDDED
ncbi:unnamed protein product [Malus baccata var. baccata]